jgi:hypothetical protein
MLTRGRSFTVFLAIAAIAAANCIGPQLVLAGHHTPASKIEHTADHATHPHSGDAHDRADLHGGGHDAGTVNDDTGTGGPSKFCCSTMTCTAGAVLAIASVTPMQAAAARAIGVPLEDMLRAFNAAAIDPPPRIG